MRLMSSMRVMTAIALSACGGAPAPAPAGPPAPAPGDESAFGPLEVGADYASFRKLTDEPFRSLDHGGRLVDVYVNEVGAGAFLSGGPIPLGTIIVKTSFDEAGGPGPIFVMEKRAPGYAPDHRDWYYALHWAQQPAAKGGPIYWRGKSRRVTYCLSCHDDYDRSIGGLVPSSLLPR